MVFSATGLLIHNILVIALSEFALLGSATILTILLSGRIQDELPSSQRSGSESAISTLSTIAFVCSVLVFTFIVKTHSIFMASWLLIIVALLATLGVRASFVRYKS